MSEFADAVRANALQPPERINHPNLPQITVCDQEDCLIQPNSENDNANSVREKLIIRVDDYEINIMCVFCIHAERKDMKEEVKRAVLKHNLRKNHKPIASATGDALS